LVRLSREGGWLSVPGREKERRERGREERERERERERKKGREGGRKEGRQAGRLATAHGSAQRRVAAMFWRWLEHFAFVDLSISQ